MMVLHNIGAHQYNFGLSLSLRLYRTFIRPILEYGLAIISPTPTHYQMLENAQKRCIRLTLNVTNPSATTLTIVSLHLANLPSIKLRARVLLFKFIFRTFHIPPTTLLACIVTSLLRRHHPPQEWINMRNNNLWKDWKKVTSQLPLPKDPFQHIINSHHQIELESRRSQFSTVAHALPERKWDPILFLPTTTLSRHRLVKWRMHWLSSFPLKDCRCGTREANHRHYANDCQLLAPMIDQLKSNFPGSIDENQHIIDAILNHLPNSPSSLKRGHWHKTWPLLLHTLRDIDICSHPDATFDPELDPR